MIFLYLKQYLDRRRSLNDGTQQEESVHFTRETATETSYTVEGPTKSFDQAKNLLIQKRMVVITGVQGSGKTFLAKSLVHDLQKDGKIEKSILICSLKGLLWGPCEQIDMYIIDDIFYELQLYENFKNTLEALSDFLSNTGKKHFIITIPSYTWVNHCYEFDAKFDQVLVDLDKREEREKSTILHSIKAQYDFTNEQSEKLIELQNNLLVTSCKCIGFPALVLWICKQPSVEKLEKCFYHPLQTMKDDISSIRKANSLEERGKFLVLSYMCLNDGKMITQNVDKKIFDSLKNKYAPKFEDKNLAEFCEGMVGYYSIKNEDGRYEFDLNIMKKIVFVSLAKKSASYVQRYCKNDYSKYIIEDKRCPRDMDIWYTECFTRI